MSAYSVKAKTGVLLVNLGTPDTCNTADVRKYLREFLMDRRVIDIPFWRRFFLVHFIIAPFRAPKSAKIYKKLWTEEGSPLKFHGYNLASALQNVLGNDYVVGFGMRYQKPTIKSALEDLVHKGMARLIIVPLYPQYSSSTTGSTIEHVVKEVQKWEVIPKVLTVNQFFEHPQFVKAFAQRAQTLMEKNKYDHFLFSYHGLPERQIKKASFQNYCQLSKKCCSVYSLKNQFCYRAQCYETSRLIAKECNIEIDHYTVCFQSRLGKTPWIKPYTDELIVELAQKGVERLLVFSPSFVADCLETTVEIGDEYLNLFRSAGGEELDLVESLNTHPVWVECLANIISKNNIRID